MQIKVFFFVLLKYRKIVTVKTLKLNDLKSKKKSLFA